MNTKMKIIIACLDDFNRVREITQTTIKQVYPMYYPAGAVDFFLNIIPMNIYERIFL